VAVEWELGKTFWVGNVLLRNTRFYRVTVRNEDGTLRVVDLRRVRRDGR
jgi:hypothetical protein